jgi:hypothetical protein
MKAEVESLPMLSAPRFIGVRLISGLQLLTWSDVDHWAVRITRGCRTEWPQDFRNYNSGQRTPLDSADVGTVKVTPSCKFFLRQSEPLSNFSHSLAELSVMSVARRTIGGW